jgi:hypothetical protein
MRPEDKKHILNIVKDAFYADMEVFSLEDIIDCCDELTEEEKEWAYDNLSATVIITED